MSSDARAEAAAVTAPAPRGATGAGPARPGVPRQLRRRPSLLAAVVSAGALVLVANTLLTAPEAPAASELWRWATLALAVPLCGWNLVAATRAYHAAGLISVVGFLHLWAFFAFSFPAVENTYRYAVLMAGRWQVPTDDPVLVQSIGLVAAFQLIFFLLLGRGLDSRLAPRLLASRALLPRRRLALLLLLLVLPFLLARLQVLHLLGFRGALTAAVTRIDFLEQLDDAIHPVVWLLNSTFPVMSVALLCLAVKYAVPHPSQLGRALYLGVLCACVGGVAVSGGRAELVLVVFTVIVFLWVQGYRSLRQFAPVLVPLAAIAVLVFLVAQARNGGSNVLTQAAGSPWVGYSWSGADVTQILGLGRFDAVVMILDRHDLAQNLLGKSFAFAALGFINSTYIPRALTGGYLPIWHPSDSVMGPWVYGQPQGGYQAAAPGELYLNFGLLGVVVGAAVLAGAVRLLFWAVGRLPGPQEFAWVLAVWTVGRTLSDETYNTAVFAGRVWPLLLLLTLLVLRRIGRDGVRA